MIIAPIKSRLLGTAAIALLASLTAASAQTSSPQSGRDQQQRDFINRTDQNPQQDRASNDSSRQTGQQRPSDDQQRARPQNDTAQNSERRSPSNAQGSQAAPSTSGTAQPSGQPDQPPRNQSGANAPSSNAPSTAQQQRNAPAGTQSQNANPSQSRSSSQATNPPSTANSQAAQPSQPSSQRQGSTSGQAPSTSQAQAPQSQAAQSGASVAINDQQRTRIAAVVARERIAPVTNVNFSVSIGTLVPRSVRVQTLPARIVSIVPQYRGYSYFVTRDQMVIVEPSTHKIVTVLPYQGGRATGARAQATMKDQPPKFSSAQRDLIRKQVVRRTPSTTKTITTTTTVTIGEPVAPSVTLEEFPETVYNDVPEVRTYRYFRNNEDLVVVDPSDRHVVDVIE
jgi:hypothetical protein